MKKALTKYAALAIALAFSSTSCMTTYDAAGNPVQSVDPGAAAAIAVGAGLAGAAIGSNHKRTRVVSPYYGRPVYRPGYRPGYRPYPHGHRY